MNTNKLWMRFLMAGLLLALLLTTACAKENVIQSSTGQALVEQGNAYMTCLKDGNIQGALDRMSSKARITLGSAVQLAGSWVDLESKIKNEIALDKWTFESAYVITVDGSLRGILDGKVAHVDGKSGKIHLEFDQENGAWMVRNSSMEE